MKNVRLLSLTICGSLLWSVSTRAFDFASFSAGLSKAMPTITKAVGAVAEIGKMATSIAIVAGGDNIDKAAANAALVAFGGLSGIGSALDGTMTDAQAGATAGPSGGFNAAGDIMIMTSEQMKVLETNMQNMSHVVPTEAPIEPKNWAKIMVPDTLGGRSMIKFPKITSGSRKGEENKIIIQLTAVSRTEKGRLKNIKPFIETKEETAAKTTAAPITKMNYKITFFSVMKTDKGDGVELASMLLPSKPTRLFGYVKPNGSLEILCTTQGIQNFASIPSEYSAEEWQNGTALKDVQEDVMMES